MIFNKPRLDVLETKTRNIEKNMWKVYRKTSITDANVERLEKENQRLKEDMQEIKDCLGGLLEYLKRNSPSKS